MRPGCVGTWSASLHQPLRFPRRVHAVRVAQCGQDGPAVWPGGFGQLGGGLSAASALPVVLLVRLGLRSGLGVLVSLAADCRRPRHYQLSCWSGWACGGQRASPAMQLLTACRRPPPARCSQTARGEPGQRASPAMQLLTACRRPPPARCSQTARGEPGQRFRRSPFCPAVVAVLAHYLGDSESVAGGRLAFRRSPFCPAVVAVLAHYLGDSESVAGGRLAFRRL